MQLSPRDIGGHSSFHVTYIYISEMDINFKKRERKPKVSGATFFIVDHREDVSDAPVRSTSAITKRN